MDSYVESAPAPALAGVVRTVWIQRTGDAAYLQRHLPTGGVEIHFPIGAAPQLVGPLTGAQLELAGDKDVALMGGGVLTAALAAGLVDELILHQVPILLGGGRPFFQELHHHVELRLVEAVPAPGVTHLHYEVIR
jgi:dihydrofolate reductase